MLHKILAAAIFIGVLIAVLKKWSLIIFGLIILYYLIRWGADIFWIGRDKGKW